jgi:hypothetical protein
MSTHLQRPRIRAKRTYFSLLLVVGLLEQASACSVCFSSDGDTLGAFHFTTAFLTLLPFLMIGSAVLLLRSRMKMCAGRGQ